MTKQTEYPLEIEDMFHRSLAERRNCAEFIDFIMTQGANIDTMRHNPRRARWQVDIKTAKGRSLSFWPHALKVVDQDCHRSVDFAAWEDASHLFSEEMPE